MAQTSLLDRSPPATPDELFERLDALNISVVKHHHPPVFTVEEAKALKGSMPGAHLKNLFLRNKKRRMWLLVTDADRPLDLMEVGTLLGSGRLSFGSSDRLMKYLGVIPGAVTPLAVVNDHSNVVQVAIAEDLLAADALNVHPLDNSMTATIAPDDLIRFLEAEDHPVQAVRFPDSNRPSDL